MLRSIGQVIFIGGNEGIDVVEELDISEGEDKGLLPAFPNPITRGVGGYHEELKAVMVCGGMDNKVNYSRMCYTLKMDEKKWIQAGVITFVLEKILLLLPTYLVKFGYFQHQ